MACRNRAYGAYGDALIDYRDAVGAGNISADRNKAACLIDQLALDFLAQLVDIRRAAVHQVDPERHRAHIEVFLLQHPHGSQNIFSSQHGFSSGFQIFEWVKAISLVAANMFSCCRCTASG